MFYFEIINHKDKAEKSFKGFFLKIIHEIVRNESDDFLPAHLFLTGDFLKIPDVLDCFH